MLKNLLASTLLRIFAIVAIIFIMGISVNRCRSSVNKMDVLDKQTEHNIKVGKDTIRIIVNKAGLTEFDKLAYEGKIENLQLLNDSLYKSLTQEKGHVISLTNAIIGFKTDSVKLVNKLQVFGSGRYGLAFKYAKRDLGSFQQIEGTSRFKLDSGGTLIPDTTVLTKNYLELGVVLGHRKTDKGFEFFATSKSPNFILKDAQSFVEVPPIKLQKRFGLGINVGYGFSVQANTVKVGPSVSLGLNYNFLNF